MTEKETPEPIGDRILLTPIAKETTLANGFRLPQSSREGTGIGLVVSVAPAQYIRNPERGSQVAPGDKVLYGVNGFLEITLENGPHLVGKESDLIIIIEKAAKQ